VLPFSPRLRIALATAEAVARGRQSRAVACSDIVQGIVSLAGVVADNLLKARGFTPSIAAVPVTAINHDPMAYNLESLRALSSAILEAANRSHELVGIEDMLVGLLSPPSAEISALLAKNNVNLEELLSEVRKEM
jgi:hypothetical protein